MSELSGRPLSACLQAVRSRFHHVQRSVCRAQERIYFFAILGISSNADTDRQSRFPSVIGKSVANPQGN